MPGGLILLNEDSHFLEEGGPLRDLVQTVSSFCVGLISKWWGYSPSDAPIGVENKLLATEREVSDLRKRVVELERTYQDRGRRPLAREGACADISAQATPGHPRACTQNLQAVKRRQCQKRLEEDIPEPREEVFSV